MNFKRVLIINIVLWISLVSVTAQEDVLNIMLKGLNSYESGEYIDSIYHMNQVLTFDGEYQPEALFWISKSYYEMENYKEARSYLDQFIRKGLFTSDYNEDARFLYCKVFFKLGRYEDALHLFNQFVRNESFTYYDKAALLWIGESYLQLGRYEEAKDSYLAYLKFFPESTLAKERIDSVERMIDLISSDSDEDDITIIDKAGWFTDFIIKEKDTYIENGGSSVLDILSEIENRDDFFTWMESLLSNKKVTEAEEIVKEDDKSIINSEGSDEKSLDALEEAILDELEKKITEELKEEP